MRHVIMARPRLPEYMLEINRALASIFTQGSNLDTLASATRVILDTVNRAISKRQLLKESSAELNWFIGVSLLKWQLEESPVEHHLNILIAFQAGQLSTSYPQIEMTTTRWQRSRISP